MATLLVLVGCADDRDPVSVGLITKQEANPYWVSMREVAEETAKDEGVTLLTATGTSDTDSASQIAAIEDMVDRGVDGILIAPTDSAALEPAVAQARAAGITVIALDTPFDPTDAVNAYFTTDNVKAGALVGEYAAAKSAELGLDPTVAMLGLTPGFLSGDQRADGFREAMGLGQDDPAIVAAMDTAGDLALSRTAMAETLVEHPDVNVVYAVNEPAALGAVAALKGAGADLSQVVVVTVDGGCVAMKSDVRGGDIDATAMQYPQNMAREGVVAIAEQVRAGEQVSGYLDTGTQLVSGSPVAGVDSRDIAFGIRTCWGE